MQNFCYNNKIRFVAITAATTTTNGIMFAKPKKYIQSNFYRLKKRYPEKKKTSTYRNIKLRK